MVPEAALSAKRMGFKKRIKRKGQTVGESRGKGFGVWSVSSGSLSLYSHCCQVPGASIVLTCKLSFFC